MKVRKIKYTNSEWEEVEESRLDPQTHHFYLIQSNMSAKEFSEFLYQDEQGARFLLKKYA